MAVAVSIDVTLPRPKTKPAPGTRHRAYYDPDLEYVAPLGGKWGDLDNYIKATLDALQDGRVIQDDCQVVELTATKCVGDEVGLFIQVSVIEPAD
jgi:Holliday junction resolvase RusA-like endonuclease